MEFQLQGKDTQTKAREHYVASWNSPNSHLHARTVGTVKGVHQRELMDEINPDIILGNTYHLFLRPQTHILEKAGGLHRFMNWDRNILTDSGGYQVYSLSAKEKILEG